MALARQYLQRKSYKDQLIPCRWAAHGVAMGRFNSHGSCDTQPLVPNIMDGNRFGNRRVGLKRTSYKALG